MPTYQYACTTPACGNNFELVQSFTDPAASECPVCGGPVRKVFSAVGVVFKGSGFYRTDSRASGEKNGKPAAKTAAESSSSSGSGDSSTASSGSSDSSSSSASSSSTGSPSSTPSSSGSGSKAAATA